MVCQTHIRTVPLLLLFSVLLLASFDSAAQKFVCPKRCQTVSRPTIIKRCERPRCVVRKCRLKGKHGFRCLPRPEIPDKEFPEGKEGGTIRVGEILGSDCKVLLAMYCGDSIVLLKFVMLNDDSKKKNTTELEQCANGEIPAEKKAAKEDLCKDCNVKEWLPKAWECLCAAADVLGKAEKEIVPGAEGSLVHVRKLRGGRAALRMFCGRKFAQVTKYVSIGRGRISLKELEAEVNAAIPDKAKVEKENLCRKGKIAEWAQKAWICLLSAADIVGAS